MSIYLGEKGITSTSANYLANLAKEVVKEAEAKLKSACALIRNTSLNGNEDIVDSTIE